MPTTILNENPVEETERAPVSRNVLTAKRPTWCPGCGDHGVLGIYFKSLQEMDIPHEKIVTIAGIGCSSRFPYFCNTHGVHFLHGRAVPFASGVVLSRPDVHVFVFGGDGDGFSIGGNHLDHTARKNFNLTYVIMDNFVYGMTKNQTSPTTPKGMRSKTDMEGAVDEPINPMKRLVGSGATFVARTATSQPKHVREMFLRAAKHPGFSVIECMSECVHFAPGSFDDLSPRKGGRFELLPEEHDRTDAAAAFKYAEDAWPGYFGVFYEVERPTKGELEYAMVERHRARTGGLKDPDLLRKTFGRFA